jgi:phosphoribosylformylglycinamidine synthase subunit PurS
MIYTVAILNKKGFKDQHGEHVLSDVRDSGIKGVARVNYFPLFSFNGDLTINEIDFISKSLLCDPVTQAYELAGKTRLRGHEIEIWFKPGVTDTVSQSVEKAVRDLGILKAVEVKTGHKYFFRGSLSKAGARQIAERLLVNPMIQTFQIS